MSLENEASLLNQFGSSVHKIAFSEIHPIFTKTKNERTHKDIELAVKFLKGLTFFSCMQKEELDLDQLLIEFINVMECATFNQGKTIFNYRDKPSKFYLILRGNVDIYVPKTEEERKIDALKLEDLIEKKIEYLKKYSTTSKDNDIKFGRELSGEVSNAKIKQLVQSIQNQKLNDNRTKMEAIRNFDDFFQSNHEEFTSKLKKTKTIGPGTYFGEIALTMDCLRSAKTVAASDVCVATLSRSDYKKILHQFERSFNDKVRFFTRLLDLNSDEAVAVAKFCYGFKERKYNYGQKIFKQGEMPQEVFVVKQGEIQITFQETPDKEQVLGPASLPRTKKAFPDKLAKFGPGNLLGESEILEAKAYQTTGASSSNDTILYVVSAHEFRNLQKNYSSIFEKMLAKHETKAAYLRGRLENIQAIGKRTEESSQRKSIIKSPKVLSSQDIQHIHSSKLFAAKVKQISLPKLQENQMRETTRKIRAVYDNQPSQQKNQDTMSSNSIFSDLAISSRPSRKSLPRAQTKSKAESTRTSTDKTPKPKNQDKTNFDDYFSTFTAVPVEPENLEFSNLNGTVSTSSLSKFVSKLKNIKLKESRSTAIGFHIKSNSPAEVYRKPLKLKTKKINYVIQDQKRIADSRSNSISENMSVSHAATLKT